MTPKLDTDQLGNVIFAQIFREGKIGLNVILKIAPVSRALFITLLHNLITFENGLKYKGNIPLAAYIHFKKTASTNECKDPESKKYVRSFLYNNFCILSSPKH